MAELQPLEEDQVQSIVASAVREAVDFIEEQISPSRIKAQDYYDGKVSIGHEDGRSKVVATKCRDTVRAIKPSLMRVFQTTENAVEFIPRSEEDVQIAEQTTKFINYKFGQLNGFKLLNNAIHDALVKKVGILRAYYEDYSKAEIHSFSYLDDNAFALLASDPDVQILEHTETVESTVQEGIEQQTKYHDCKVSRTRKAGKICVDAIPPEEFFINREARSFDDFYVCGHRTEMTVGQLVEMGFDYDEVAHISGNISGSSETAQEAEARRGYFANNEDENSLDPTSKNLMVTEAYMKIDVDGTGVPVLHKFVCAGSGYKILDQMMCDEVPFAAFECDPEPHTFFGSSIVDLLINDQDASTSVLRGILDNVALVNTPRMAVTNDVNMEDMLNAEVGGIVRTRQIGAIQSLDIPFTAGQTLSALQYMDQLVEQKTGVTRASVGLRPDQLQSMTKTGVDAQLSAQQGQVEVIARHIAEGGLKRLFKLLLRLTTKHQDAPSVMRLNNEFIPIDPRAWDVEMDMKVNVGLGTGREEEKKMALAQTLQMQREIYQQYGPSNGVVTLTNIRNTISDFMAANGIHNSTRYFQSINPEKEAQLQQMAAQKAQEQQQMAIQNDPNTKLLQAETLKAQTKAQTDREKMALESQKVRANDDLERDKMDQELLVKAAETLGKYGTAVDVEQIRQQNKGMRDVGG